MLLPCQWRNHQQSLRSSSAERDSSEPTIKMIKRMAYGFRDSDYFFLKIKADFPGKAR